MSTEPINLKTRSRARVLVVDDHPGTAETLARVLSQLGPAVEVLSATTARSALDRVKDGAVDLLITDMMMPDMNGLELIERLEAHPGGRPSFTILITAYDVPGLRESARRLKVNEIVIKPFRPERIFEIVRTALQDVTAAEGTLQDAEARRSFKILVADDVADNVALLARYLENEGYQLLTVSDGFKALEQTRLQMPDLVLLDINMPQMDGFEVLREIRADPAVEHIPVIMLTAARVDPSEMRAGLNLGADDYVTKPFDRRELLARIRTKLRAKEAEAAVRRRYNGLRVLPEIGRALGARLDVDELIDVTLRQAVETIGAMGARLLVFDEAAPRDKEYRVSGASECVNLLRCGALDALLEQVKHGPPCTVIDDPHQDPRWQAGPEDPRGSLAIVPLLGRLNLVGMLILVHERTGYFVPEQQLLLQAIASQACIALEAARLYAQLMRTRSRTRRRKSEPAVDSSHPLIEQP